MLIKVREKTLRMNLSLLASLCLNLPKRMFIPFVIVRMWAIPFIRLLSMKSLSFFDSFGSVSCIFRGVVVLFGFILLENFFRAIIKVQLNKIKPKSPITKFCSFFLIMNPD